MLFQKRTTLIHFSISCLFISLLVLPANARRTPTLTPTPTPGGAAGIIRVAHTQPYDYSSITSALANATSGSTILVVADGNYTTGTGEQFPLRLRRNITIQRENPASLPHIIGDRNSTVIYAEGFSDYNTVIDGFWISGGRGYLWQPPGWASASRLGGGMFFNNCDLTVKNCRIADNHADYNDYDYGGGAFLWSSNPTFLNCSILNNTADDGAGIDADEYSHPTLINCEFSDNTAVQSGGGLYAFFGNPSLTNCTFYNNQAQWGAAIFCDSSNPTLMNCSMAENMAISNGGAVYCFYDSSPSITNSILWNNFPEEIYVESGIPSVDFSDIFGNYLGIGNIDIEPRFASILNGDLHLLAGSPCIDMGTNTGAPAFDIDGEARPNPDTKLVDMGADEYYSGYVTHTPTNTPTMTSTATPTPSGADTWTPTPTATPLPPGPADNCSGNAHWEVSSMPSVHTINPAYLTTDWDSATRESWSGWPCGYPGNGEEAVLHFYDPAHTWVNVRVGPACEAMVDATVWVTQGTCDPNTATFVGMSDDDGCLDGCLFEPYRAELTNLTFEAGVDYYIFASYFEQAGDSFDLFIEGDIFVPTATPTDTPIPTDTPTSTPTNTPTNSPTPTPLSDPIIDLGVLLQGFYNPSTGIQVDTNITVELRTGASPDTAVNVAATYSLTLDAQGNTGSVALGGIGEDDYYLVIKHYNHLPVITLSSYHFGPGTTLLADLADPNSPFFRPLYGSNPMNVETDGMYSLYGCNADGNCYINVLDAFSWIQGNGYRCQDASYLQSVDFDGNCYINVLDAFMWTQVNGNQCYVP